GSRRRHGRESRAVLLRSGRKHGHSQTPSAGREQSRGTDHSDLGMSSWTDRMPPPGKKRTGFGPHPESEHRAQMRLECRSRTAISWDSRERREQHISRPAEKADRFWSAPRKRTPRPDAAGMPIAHSHFLGKAPETRAAYQTTGRKTGQVLIRTQNAHTPARCGWNAERAQPLTQTAHV